MAFCVNCGNKLESGVKFCTNCGHPVIISSGSNVQDTPQQTIVYVQAQKWYDRNKDFTLEKRRRWEMGYSFEE